MKMTPSEVLVQLDVMEATERGLVKERKTIALSLRALRVVAGLSLREVAPTIGVTAQTVHNIERGRTWTTKTARALARFYKQSAA